MTHKNKYIAAWLGVIAVSLTVLLITSGVFIESFVLVKGGMEPGLSVGERVFFYRDVFQSRLPNRGAVISFYAPLEPEILIRRVIGLPGDSVKVQSHQIHINGVKINRQALSESPDQFEEVLGDRKYQVLYKEENLYPNRADMEPIEVPEGFYFVLSDNRNHSTDSRDWGLIAREDITGYFLMKW